MKVILYPKRGIATKMMLRHPRLKWVVAGLISLSTFIETPLDELLQSISKDSYMVTVGQFITGVLLFAAMWKIQPWTRARLKWHRLGYRWITVAFVAWYLLLPGFLRGQIPLESLGKFLGALALSLSIGFSEEILARGLVFGVFEKKNIWIAVSCSSIAFGLFHLNNLRNGYSTSYTLMQVINATGGGFLLAGLMVFTGSIWMPVLFHALYDFPMVTIAGLGTKSFVIAPTDVAWALTNAGLDAAIGLTLTYFSQPRLKSLKSRALRWKLAEE